MPRGLSQYLAAWPFKFLLRNGNSLTTMTLSDSDVKSLMSKSVIDDILYYINTTARFQWTHAHDLICDSNGEFAAGPHTEQLFISVSDIQRDFIPPKYQLFLVVDGETVMLNVPYVLICTYIYNFLPFLCPRIDCAGILKLRNSDIELRKGETDIGRKNTRVRLVFRVHINQPNGRTVSLQAASNPIECCK